MSADMSGGLSGEREFVFAAQPHDPEMRETVNVWVWDDGGQFGLPRVAIEAVADLEVYEKVFPETRFVMTHRDVSNVLPSVADLYYLMLQGGNDGTDPHDVGRLNMEQ